MRKLSFKEYYESKMTLMEQNAAITPIRFKTTHTVYKYCKIPLQLNEDKIYVSFKPNDQIVIEWERNKDELTPLNLEMRESICSRYWSGQKMKTWISQSTYQVF